MAAVVENNPEERVPEKDAGEAAVTANNNDEVPVREMNASPDEAPANNSSNNSTAPEASQQQVSQTPEKQGLFGKIFRRRKQEPAITNGEADLLDDARQEPDEEATKSASEDEDDEEESGGDEESAADESENEEEEESDSEDGDTSDGESSEGDESQQRETTQQNTGENFADFRHGSRYAEEEDDDETAEFTSLIGSSGAPNDTTLAGENQDKNNNRKKGGLLGRIFRKKSQEQRGADETKGLLGYDEDDSVEEQFLATTSYRENGDYEENDEPQRRGLQSESSKDDDNNEESSDDNSILDNDGYDKKYPYETQGNQELHGRIRGYGSESAIHGNGSFTVDGSSRFYDTMTDDPSRMSGNRGYDPDMVKKGPLAGVGNVVQNIFRNRRGSFDSEDERKRMIAYIDELQWKLRQKDNEIQSWKARTEHLEKEVKRLRGEDESDEDNDEKASECESEGGDDHDEEEEEEDDNEDAQYDLLVMDASESQNEDNDGDSQAKDGTLIDMAAQRPDFDPLTSKKENNQTPKTDNELLAGYHTAESAPQNEDDEDHFEAFQSASQVLDANNREEQEGGPAKVDTETDVFEDALEENSTCNVEEEEEEEDDKPNDGGSEMNSDLDGVDDAQYKFLSAISAPAASETPEKNLAAKVSVVTPT